MKLFLSVLLFLSLSAAGQNYQAKIYDLIDLSGYFTTDANSGWNFFDAQKYLATPVVDPKNGITTDTTSTGNPRHGWNLTQGSPQRAYGIYGFGDNNNGIKYPMNTSTTSRCRFIIDMAGLKDFRDTTKKFSITNIYGLDAEETGHKIYFYNFDKVLRQSFANRPIYIARPDSLLTPFDSLTTNGTGGWISSTVDSTANINAMRYIMVVITYTVDQHKSQWAELSIYGKYLYDTTTVRASIRPHFYTGTLPATNTANYTYGKRIGSCIFKFYGPTTLAHDGIINAFTGTNYYDTANALGVPAKYRFWPATVQDFSVARMQSHVASGKELLMTNQYANQYNSDGSHFSGGYAYSRWNEDVPGAEPEDPQQYKRSADFAYNYAAIFGSVAVSKSNTKWLDDAGVPNGLNIQKDFQFGNETEGNGASYLADFYKTSADFDGHGGTVGVSGRSGIYNADPSARLMMAGMIDPDINKVKCFAFASALTRADGIFPAQVMPVHKYFSNRDFGNGNTFGYDVQIGMHAESPEKVYHSDVIQYFDNFARSVYAYVDTSVLIYQTEQGMANTFHSATTQSEAAAGNTPYATPSFGGWDSLKAKSILQQRYKILINFTQVIRYTEYAMTNQPPEGINYAAPIFQSFGKISGSSISNPFDATGYWPDYYFNSCFYDNLKDYVKDAVVVNGDSTGVWRVRFRNINRSDSICMLTWLGSYTGASLSGQTIPLNMTGAVNEVLPSFTSITGTTNALTASAGNVTRTITEIPAMYFGIESGGGGGGSGPAISPRVNVKPKRIIKIH